MRKSQFDWKVYLEYKRPDININSFKSWCYRNRPKKYVFNTEQELLEILQLYDNRQTLSRFNWKVYLEYKRPDINTRGFISWCINNRPKKSVFNTEQELLQTISLYDNRSSKIKSQFNWRQYLQENKSDINIYSFTGWCVKYRDKMSIFDTEQELLRAISLYNNRQTLSKFNWRQYLQENKPDINTKSFESWCINNRPKKSVFNTEQELLEAICVYDLNKKYIIRKTQYESIYNLIEKETGLKFNFYRLEDMIGLIQ